ncbi:MAG: PQQ-binding-like beta-propeller repeat protein [Planctomycetota bacterium]
MSLCRCLLFLTLALAAVGCSSTRPAAPPPGAEFRTGLPLEPGYAQQLGYATRWAFAITLESKQSIHAVTLQDDLVLVVERPRNIVTAIRYDDGTLAWKAILGQPLEKLYRPIANDQHVFVNSSRRLFTLNRRSGELLKTANLPHPVDMSPLLIGDQAIFGSITGRIYAFDVNASIPIWAYGLRGRVTTTPLLNNLQIFAVDSTGHYAMLQANTGELRFEGETYGPVSAPPAFDLPAILLASEDQSLYSILTTTGTLRWPAFRSEVPLTRAPVVIEREVYILEPGIGLSALNAATGETRWSIPDDLTPLLQHREHLLAHDGKSLHRLDPATGRSTFSVPLQPSHSLQITPEQNLLIVAKNGELMRITPQP